MRVVWDSQAFEDYRELKISAPALAGKTDRLIEDIKRDPFTGLGKPEPLRGELSGWWSRRVAKGHRLVYRVVGRRGQDQRLEISQCRFHYS